MKITIRTIQRRLAGAAAVVILAACSHACREQAPPPVAPTPAGPRLAMEATGEEFLVSALDEVEGIAASGGRGLNGALPSKRQKAVIAAAEADTVYVYGEVTPDGYGAVVTERHTYPKGVLLITVRKSYGKPPSHVVTETKRYISFTDFAADSAQQSNITELYGLSADTIVTHVTRNGLIETYTFRLPVVTRVVSPTDGSVRVTSRYGAAGSVRSEIRDGSGALIQVRITSGAPDGSLNVYTEFPDGSWRNTRTIGEADGTVLHETTSGS